MRSIDALKAQLPENGDAALVPATRKVVSAATYRIRRAADGPAYLGLERPSVAVML